MEEVTIGKARILHGDCMEFMRSLPDKCYELCIVDPPFGIGMHSQIGKKKGEKGNKWIGGEWDNGVPSKDYFDELFRVSKNQIIWGGNYFLDYLGATRCFCVWDKMNGTNPMADAELAWTSFESSVRMFRMHHFSAGYDSKIHPTQKPTPLYSWLFSNYAKQGDKIFDSHGGSMSSVIAALNLGFEITCLELDSDYYAAGVARVRQSQQQTRMFEPEVVMPKQDTLI